MSDNFDTTEESFESMLKNGYDEDEAYMADREKLVIEQEMIQRALRPSDKPKAQAQQQRFFICPCGEKLPEGKKAKAHRGTCKLYASHMREQHLAEERFLKMAQKATQEKAVDPFKDEPEYEEVYHSETGDVTWVVVPERPEPEPKPQSEPVAPAEPVKAVPVFVTSGFDCPVCHHAFSNKGLLGIHMKKAHQVGAIANGEDRHETLNRLLELVSGLKDAVLGNKATIETREREHAEFVLKFYQDINLQQKMLVTIRQALDTIMALDRKYWGAYWSQEKTDEVESLFAKLTVEIAMDMANNTAYTEGKEIAEAQEKKEKAERAEKEAKIAAQKAADEARENAIRERLQAQAEKQLTTKVENLKENFNKWMSGEIRVKTDPKKSGNYDRITLVVNTEWRVAAKAAKLRREMRGEDTEAPSPNLKGDDALALSAMKEKVSFDPAAFYRRREQLMKEVVRKEIDRLLPQDILVVTLREGDIEVRAEKSVKAMKERWIARLYEQVEKLYELRRHMSDGKMIPGQQVCDSSSWPWPLKPEVFTAEMAADAEDEDSPMRVTVTKKQK